MRRATSTLAWALALAGPVTGWAADSLFNVTSRWQDDQGHNVHLSDWSGHPLVITMAYGTCRKVCSTSIRRMEQTQALADERGQHPEFVVVSLDPEADTPEDWQAFRRAHHLLRGNWHFIRGAAQDTRALAHLLGIGYWVYDDHVVHDFKIVRTDRHGVMLRALVAADEDPLNLLPEGDP